MSTAARKRAWRALWVAVGCVLVIAAIAVANAVVKPPRKGDAGGATWASYLALPPNSVDVLFFGTSHAFSSIDPATIWRRGGIPSFVLAGPMQPLSLTEFYVREALRTQRPKLIVLEVSGLSYDASKFNREFHKINVGYMPWDANRVQAALVVSPPGERLGTLLDLWTLHDRGEPLTVKDFDLLGKDAGYEFLKGFKPSFVSREVTSAPYAQTAAARAEADAEVAANLPALRRIAQAAKEAKVPLLLLLTPTSPPGGYSYHLQKAAEALRTDYPDVQVLDLSQEGAVSGLSYQTDFLDGGHLTYLGAEKVGIQLARVLAQAYGLADLRQDPAYASWNADAAARDDYINGRLPREKRRPQP
jgi:hypothetical protein